jgi:L-aspartate oxidase
LRGEGGLLRRPDGTRFMPEHDPREELAPRDVVARAIDFEMKKAWPRLRLSSTSATSRPTSSKPLPQHPGPLPGAGHRHHPPADPGRPRRALLLRRRRDRLQRAPTWPACYAVGESACTGLHGANRLASNSLLECLVFGEAAAEDILEGPATTLCDLPQWDESRVTDADEAIVISHNWDELRRFMWDYVGIVRTNKRLRRAQHRIRLLAGKSTSSTATSASNDLIELRNLVVTADLIVRCALKRKESRGLHFSRDYPGDPAKARDTVIRPTKLRS